MAVSKAQQRATNKYKKNNYDRMELVVPKGQKDTIKAHAADLGESVNGFIGRAISETMERDGGGMPSETAGKPAGAAQGAGVVSPAASTAQEKAETEKQPDSVDKAKAWENILEIFHDVGTVDLERARDERLGIMFLPPDTLEAAQRAAEAAGQTVLDFMRRAVETQAQRDKKSLQLGINPVTGAKLEKEA